MARKGLHSFMAGGCARTSKPSLCPGSHTVTGSTNAPVENSQCRTAPTPLPSILARIGNAMPVRKTHSAGAGSSLKPITLSHTLSGGASISMVETTSCRGGAGSLDSTPASPGAPG